MSKNTSLVFNLGGALYNDKPLIKEIIRNKKFIDDNITLEIYGAFWTSISDNIGGRKNVDIKSEEIIKIISAYNKLNIKFWVTFNIPKITYEDCKHKKMNDILRILNNNLEHKNGVICSDDKLAMYIKYHYPMLDIKCSLISSVEKIPLSINRNINHYIKSLSLYDYVVIHSDDIYKEYIYDLPEKHRFEILMDERCIRNCKFRKIHYRSNNKSCLYKDFYNIDVNSNPIEYPHTTTVSIEKFQDLVNKGFTKFKFICARDRKILDSEINCSNIKYTFTQIKKMIKDI